MEGLNSSVVTSASSEFGLNSSNDTFGPSEVGVNSSIGITELTDVDNNACTSSSNTLIESSDDGTLDDKLLEKFLGFHEKCEKSGENIQCECTKPVTEDKCVQVNTIQDLYTSRMNVMDLLRNNERLNSWTGLPVSI